MRWVDTFSYLGLLDKHCNLLHIKKNLSAFSHFSSIGYSSICCPASISKWPSCSFGSSSLSANTLKYSGIFKLFSLELLPRSNNSVNSFKIECPFISSHSKWLTRSSSNVVNKSCHSLSLNNDLENDWELESGRIYWRCSRGSKPFRVARYKRHCILKELTK